MPLLHGLLLLLVPLLQLLCLLLVPLFNLLRASRIGTVRSTLIFLLLLLLQFLPLLILLGSEFIVLTLISLVQVWIAGVGRGRTLGWR